MLGFYALQVRNLIRNMESQTHSFYGPFYSTTRVMNLISCNMEWTLIVTRSNNMAHALELYFTVN